MKIIQSKEQETRVVFFFFLMSIHIKGITFLREKKMVWQKKLWPKTS